MTPVTVSDLSASKSLPFCTTTNLKLHTILFHIITMKNTEHCNEIVEGELNWHYELRKPKSPLSYFIKLDRLLTEYGRWALTAGGNCHYQTNICSLPSAVPTSCSQGTVNYFTNSIGSCLHFSNVEYWFVPEILALHRFQRCKWAKSDIFNTRKTCDVGNCCRSWKIPRDKDWKDRAKIENNNVSVHWKSSL